MTANPFVQHGPIAWLIIKDFNYTFHRNLGLLTSVYQPKLSCVPSFLQAWCNECAS